MPRRASHRPSQHEPPGPSPTLQLRGLVATIDARKAANETENPREMQPNPHHDQYPQNLSWQPSESERQHYLAVREQLVRHPGPDTLLRQIEIRRAAQQQREREAEVGSETEDVRQRERRWRGLALRREGGGAGGAATEHRRAGDQPLGSLRRDETPGHQMEGEQARGQQGEEESSNFSDDETLVEMSNFGVQRV